MKKSLSMDRGILIIIFSMLLNVVIVSYLFVIIDKYGEVEEGGRFATTNIVKVIDKEISNRIKISVRDKDFDKEKYINFDIYLKNENVWNLIEEGKTYFVVYTQNNNGEFILEQIEIVKNFSE